LKVYRIDEKIEQVEMSTNHTPNNLPHLFKLFKLKLKTIEPAIGIELFTLEALKVEHVDQRRKHCQQQFV
jgi:protein ImuB